MRNWFKILKGSLVILALLAMLCGQDAYAQVTLPTDNNCASDDPTCQVCADNTQNHNVQLNTKDAGAKLISQIFQMINDLLLHMESSFYNGIINNPAFQQMVGVSFILYIMLYGLMIMFNLASYRSGEVASRMIKVAIVYAMCTASGWTAFSAFVQTPIIGGINNLIMQMAAATSGGGTSCDGTSGFVSNFTQPPILSSGTTASTYTMSLFMGPPPDYHGPMEILYGPMNCIFRAKFILGIQALLVTGFYGWILALILMWGMMEFIYLVMGALVTYVKAIVGLAFLFGLAPIFFAFYLFEKTRAITEGWINMVVGFALQPVMLFAFLAFYATIISAAIANLFTDNAGRTNDVCYVPFYSMPGLFDVYWWRFTKYVAGKNVAGGNWVNIGGSGDMGAMMQPPTKILSILYFVVLSSLGKNFSTYINDLSMLISGGRGGGVVTGEQVGAWFKSNISGGRGLGGLASDGAESVGRGVSNITTRMNANLNRPI